MIALVPADAGTDAMGPLPDGVELAVLGTGVPAKAEFCVLGPPDGDRFAEILPELTALKVVQTLSAGIDRVPELPAGVTLCNAGGVHDGPVAEWIIGVILAMNKDLPHYLERQRAGEWDTAGNTAFSGAAGAADLAEQHVLIVGHGSIGRALHDRLAPFGTKVTGIARHPRDGVLGPDDLPRLLPGADVIVLLAPLTAETKGMVDAAFLAAMRPGALLVNAARGALVQTPALLGALRAGRVRAALDATDPEPLPPGHPLFSAPGALITPHVAGSSEHWRDRAYRMVGDQLRRYAAGEPLANVRRHGY
ncbi:2-hydroxyacid dehydrogenase [Actinomadura sp. 3N508]|uniref:2-hydroxyacid dehydrogenase n=1 Tax=Actinomadura sp. 3N508 TaxID=3375153 RepID=UPI0037AC2ABA